MFEDLGHLFELGNVNETSLLALIHVIRKSFQGVSKVPEAGSDMIEVSNDEVFYSVIDIISNSACFLDAGSQVV